MVDPVNQIESSYPSDIIDGLKNHVSLPAIMDLNSRFQQLVNDFVVRISGAEKTNLKAISEKSVQVFIDGITEITREKGNPIIFLGVVGPGGSGKDSIINDIRNGLGKENITMNPLLNNTTRAQRQYEINGVHYQFRDLEQLSNLLVNLNITSALATDLRNSTGLILIKNGSPLENIDSTSIDLNLCIELTNEYFSAESLKKIETRILELGLPGYSFNIDLKNIPFENGHPISFSYKSGRGWYLLMSDDLVNLITKNQLIYSVEDPVSLHKIGEWLTQVSTNILFKIICVLPPEPVVLHSAARALSRDGVNQSSASILSTIGERQIQIMEDVFTKIPVEDLVLLINDKQNPDGTTFIGNYLAEELASRLKKPTS